MKIFYTKELNLTEREKRVYGDKIAYKFVIKKSILKTHFKELMALLRFGVKNYDGKEKIGFISKDNANKFLILVEQIEKSSDVDAEKSHQKSKELYKTKKNGESEICDHSDLASIGYTHGEIVKCPSCGSRQKVW